VSEQSVEKDAGRASIVPTEQEYADSRAELLRIFAEQYVTDGRAPTATVLRATEGLHGRLVDAIIESGWENAEHTALREWAFGQLDRIINAVRGKPKPLHQHSLHDVAKRVEKALRTRPLPPEGSDA
jgi:hypothetical protein